MRKKRSKKERKISSDFGLYLKNLRESRGLSLADVQEWTGISTSYLNRMEHGERRAPTLPIIYQLSKFYRIPVQEMIKVALNIDTDGFESETSFETLIFSTDFVLNNKRVNQEAKSKLVELINFIDNIPYEGKIEIQQMLEIISIVEDLKKELKNGIR